MRQLPALLSIPALLIGAFSANAGVVYNSLPQTTTGHDEVSSYGPLYDSFSTGSDLGPISSVMFMLFGTNTDGGSISVSLYADNGSTAGSLISALGTINDATLTGSPSVISLSLSHCCPRQGKPVA